MNKVKLIAIIAIASVGLSVSANVLDKTLSISNPIPAVEKPVSTSTPTVIRANSLDMVARPNFYLNKTVTVKAKFDKFSALGLDYKPAMRSSEDYISFLIQRDDFKDHNIPLSEMKIFIKRTDAEKYIELNSGDEIEFTGKVFSTALGDVWMDASKFTVISSKASLDKAKK